GVDAVAVWVRRVQPEADRRVTAVRRAENERRPAALEKRRFDVLGTGRQQLGAGARRCLADDAERGARQLADDDRDARLDDAGLFERDRGNRRAEVTFMIE